MDSGLWANQLPVQVQMPGYGREGGRPSSGPSSKPAGRSRPTNNQLLYKAHFRWKHYTCPLPPGKELSLGTEACASVTSAFLQVLATVADVERCRLDKPRNILHILSANTRRTKVVELSSGTHRVADELRRHSLADGAGGQYSTNLDRNRYGSDNNYLFTVTRFNLECLGLCPCLVDIEIMDTRNGNEVQLVTAGPMTCTCESPARRERANLSNCADSGLLGSGLPLGGTAAAAQRSVLLTAAGASPARRSPSAGNLRRVSSASALRRAPSATRDLSRVSNGSELFDALLTAAATDERGGDAATSRARRPGEAGTGAGAGPGGNAGTGPGAGAGPGTGPGAGHDRVSLDRAPAGGDGRGNHSARGGRSRIVWNASFTEVDSLQAAIDAFRSGNSGSVQDLERAGGAGAGRPRGMLRRNSVSMIVENPVLAQTGAGGDSMLLGGLPPPLYGSGMHAHLLGAQGLSAGGHAGPTPAGHAGMEVGEGEGDNEHADGDDAHPGAGGLRRSGDGDGADGVPRSGVPERRGNGPGLLRCLLASSAVSLNRLAAGGSTGAGGETRRLVEELRGVHVEVSALEGGLEESRLREAAAKRLAAAAETAAAEAQAELRVAQAALRRLSYALLQRNGDADRDAGVEPSDKGVKAETAPESTPVSASPYQGASPGHGSGTVVAGAPSPAPGVKAEEGRDVCGSNEPSPQGDAALGIAMATADAAAAPLEAARSPEDSTGARAPAAALQGLTLPTAYLALESELAAAHEALDAAHAVIRRLGAERGVLEQRLRAGLGAAGASAAGGGLPTLFRAGSTGSALASPQAPQHAHGPGSSPSVPLFGTAPLNPYGGMHASAFRPPLSQRTLQKVASMPAIAGSGDAGEPLRLEPAVLGLVKRAREASPIPEGDETSSPGAAPCRRRRGATDGEYDGERGAVGGYELPEREASTPSPAVGDSMDHQHPTPVDARAVLESVAETDRAQVLAGIAPRKESVSHMPLVSMVD